MLSWQDISDYYDLSEEEIAVVLFFYDPSNVTSATNPDLHGLRHCQTEIDLGPDSCPTPTGIDR